ncbi:MAG TPA: DNA cytosine methyltransferase [Chitinophaga sp.]|nr:DNA cytosine methyltransferase [Chitinophaga sp.]
MSKKNSYITVTDQFCGAGGSSQGVRRLALKNSGGLEVKLALNHWKLAIETHNTNFPDTLHDCTDISACDPRRYPATDILITSPECTNHSLAKGVKVVKKQMDLFDAGKLDPAAERSRATMWDVCRFAEYHNYNAIIVENVVDARKWVMFDAWLSAMYALGYLHRCVYLNSMHCHPTPQSRDRMYIVFWKKGNKAPILDYMPTAHCPKCGKDVQAIQTWKNADKKFGKYKQQYVYCCPSDGTVVEPYYYAAFNCIDWSDLGIRIGDRKKSLSANTVKRIQYGLKKYGNQPLQVISYSPGYTKPITESSGTFTTNDHHGILNPFIINDQHSKGIGYRVRGCDDLINTIVTDPKFKLVTPFIIKQEHSLNNENARAASGPFQTQTTRQSMAVVTPPLMTEMYGNGTSRQATEPLNTVTAGGIKTGIITNEAFNSFIASYYNGSNCTKHITQEMGAVTTGDRHTLVSYQQPTIEDCHYRMLKPSEIKLGMAFDPDYVVLGSGKDQVKQLGNAVTPPAMEWLVQQVIESLK